MLQKIMHIENKGVHTLLPPQVLLSQQICSLILFSSSVDWLVFWNWSSSQSSWNEQTVLSASIDTQTCCHDQIPGMISSAIKSDDLTSSNCPQINLANYVCFQYMHSKPPKQRGFPKKFHVWEVITGTKKILHPRILQTNWLVDFIKQKQ